MVFRRRETCVCGTLILTFYFGFFMLRLVFVTVWWAAEPNLFHTCQTVTLCVCVCDCVAIQWFIAA